MGQRKYTVEIEHDDAVSFIDYWDSVGWEDKTSFIENIVRQLRGKITPSFNNRLTEHFSLQEFMQSETAQQRGIDNWKQFGQEEYDNLLRLCKYLLQPVRNALNVPIIISSGFSNDELSLILGRNPTTTQHRKGQAADIYSTRMPVAELFCQIATKFPYDQIILEKHSKSNAYAGWVHVSYVATTTNRREVLAWDGKKYHEYAGPTQSINEADFREFISTHALP